MANPNEIHVVMNASDGYSFFEKNGYPDSHLNIPGAADIIDLIGRQEGRLFRLPGWVEGYAEPVILKVVGSGESTIDVENMAEPPFTGTYEIAPEPTPFVAMPNGDYIFKLVKPATE